MMDNIQEWCNTLSRGRLVSNGVSTAFWVSENDGPVALFIHGINGSHYGLAELARDMSNFKVVLLDLPGHGESSIPKWIDIENLRLWFNDIYRQVSANYGEISDVIAHSFGCYAITDTDSRTTLICPVPTVSPVYNTLSRASGWLFKSRLITKLYNYPPLSTERGFTMIRRKTRANWRLMYWIANNDHLASPEQRLFQAKLSRLVQQKDIFHNIDCEQVIIGKYDSIARERTRSSMGKIFPNAKISIVSAGHLAPIEEPKQIAKIIIDR